MGEKPHKFLIVVRSIINNQKGEVLLVKRSKDHTYNPLYWELPGGKLVPGEDLEDALERILNKEVNIIVEVLDGTYYCKNKGILQYGKYKGYSYIEIAMISRYVAGKVEISKEHTDYVWVDLESSFKYELSIESKKALTSYMRDILYPKELGGAHKVPVLLVARTLIFNNKGEFLIIRRAHDDKDGGLWEIPGGKIDKLEILNDSLSREVLEETGLLVEIIEPAAFTQTRLSNEGKYSGYTVVMIVGTAKVRGGIIKLSNEHDDYKWIKAKDIYKYELSHNLKYAILDILSK